MQFVDAFSLSLGPLGLKIPKFEKRFMMKTPKLENRASLRSRQSGPLKGEIEAPGDKSISHRALILGAMAKGETLIYGLLEGEDIMSTLRAMQSFGAEIEAFGSGNYRVLSQGGLAEPQNVIDCGNAGTGVRLIMGAASGYNHSTTFTGDFSLIKRPMGRVLEPLGLMGLKSIARSGGRLPLTISGGGLKAIDYKLPVASAQVKSALLLAALNAKGVTTVIEAEPTRDHTERMLKGFGARISIKDESSGRHISIEGGQTLRGTKIVVPGDPSSAAFMIVAALIVPGSNIIVKNILLNPSRIGLLGTLKEMGGNIVIHNEREIAGECIGDIHVTSSSLKGVIVPPERAPSMIDEYPILCVAAALAEGQTIMHGIGEMRVKESDRIALMAAGLKTCGVQIEEEPDGMVVTGALKITGGGEVETQGDHRIAMSHLILGLVSENPISVYDPEMIATSFPNFVSLMNGLGAEIG
jgi:3-phosphoshikimate 1-carboxyvinyltransferase